MGAQQCDLVCLDLPKAEALRRSAPSMGIVQAAARSAKALSDPTRLMLAVFLNEDDDLCVCDLAWITGSAQNLVSHHLKALKSAGLVTSRREGKTMLHSLTGYGRSLVGDLVNKVSSR